MTSRPEKRFYSFGAFRVDLVERLLFKEDHELALTPKVFDTLLVLLENSSHVLTRQELMKKVWPDSFVEENNLAQNISMLRKILGEDYIQTIPKRGYRFIARVNVRHGDAAPAFPIAFPSISCRHSNSAWNHPQITQNFLRNLWMALTET